MPYDNKEAFAQFDQLLMDEGGTASNGYDHAKAFERLDNIIEYDKSYSEAKNKADSDLAGRRGAIDTLGAYGGQMTAGVARPFVGALTRAGEAMGLVEEGSADRAGAQYDAKTQAMNEAGYYPEKEEGFWNNLDYYAAHGLMGAAQNAPTSLIGGGIGAAATRGAIGLGRAATGTRAVAGTAAGLRAATVSAKAGQYGALAGQVGLFSASAADMAYTQAKSQGMTDEESRLYALKQGANEGIITTAFNLVGAGGIERMIAKGLSKTAAEKAVQQAHKGVSNAFKRFGVNVTQELAEELTIETIANLIEAENLDPSADDFENMVDTWAMTAAQTVFMTGGMQAGGAAMSGAANQVPFMQRRAEQQEKDFEAGKADLAREAFQEATGVTAEQAAEMQQYQSIIETRQPEFEQRMQEEAEKAEAGNATEGFDGEAYADFYKAGVFTESEQTKANGEFTEEDYDATYGDDAFATYQTERAFREVQQQGDELQEIQEEQEEAAEGVTDVQPDIGDYLDLAGENNQGQELWENPSGEKALNEGTEEDPDWKFQETGDNDPVWDVDKTSEEIEAEAEALTAEEREEAAAEEFAQEDAEELGAAEEAEETKPELGDVEVQRNLRLAEQGDPEAQYNLGEMYQYGRGVSEDEAEAVKWYRLAAEQGHAEAQYNLGVSYDHGDGVPEDVAEGMKWYRKAAEQGESKAQYHLGLKYSYGQGVPQDEAEAVKWFRKAAKQGHAEAQYNLGVAYEEGDGVPEDVVEAVKWYRKAAEQGDVDAQNSLDFMAYDGDPEAQYNLGVMYDQGPAGRGKGVPQDDVEAVKWFRLAAEQGHAKARNRLDSMDDLGLGVPQDEAAEETKPEQEDADSPPVEAAPAETGEKVLRSWQDGKDGNFKISLTETADGKFRVQGQTGLESGFGKDFEAQKEADVYYSKKRQIAVEHGKRKSLREDDAELGIVRDEDGRATEESLEEALDKHFKAENPWQEIARAKNTNLKESVRKHIINLETEPLGFLAQKKLANVYQERDGIAEAEAMDKARSNIQPWTDLFIQLREKRQEHRERYKTESEYIHGKGLENVGPTSELTSLESDIRQSFIDVVYGKGREEHKSLGENAKTRLARGIAALEGRPAKDIFDDPKYRIPEREMGSETDEGSQRGKYNSTKGTKTQTVTHASGSIDVTSALHMFGTIPKYWQAEIETEQVASVSEIGTSREEAVEKAVAKAVTNKDKADDYRSKVYTQSELLELVNLPEKNLRRRELRFIAAARYITGAETLQFKYLAEAILADQKTNPRFAKSEEAESKPGQEARATAGKKLDSEGFSSEELAALQRGLEGPVGDPQNKTRLRNMGYLIDESLSDTDTDKLREILKDASATTTENLIAKVEKELGKKGLDVLLAAADQDWSVLLAASVNPDTFVTDMPSATDNNNAQKIGDAALAKIEAYLGKIPEGAFIDENGNIQVPYTVTAKEFNDELDVLKELMNPRSKDNVNIDAKANSHGLIPQEAADKIKQQWQAEIDKQRPTGRGPSIEAAKDNYTRVIISLFDRTGEWSRPWAEAGYHVIRFDTQEDGAVNEEGEPVYIGDFHQMSVEDITYDMISQLVYESGNEVYGVLAGVPCTHFSRAGNKFWADKDADGRTSGTNTEGEQVGVNLVDVTTMLIQAVQPAMWAIENPMGRIQELGGLPDPALRFQPNNFGDPYTKETLLWGKMNPQMPIAPSRAVDGSIMHTDYGGRSIETKNARAVTPKGFARSFFLANNYAGAPADMKAAFDSPFFAPQIVDAVNAGLTYEEALYESENYDPNIHDTDELVEALNQKLREKEVMQSQTRLADVAGLAPFTVYRIAATGFHVREDNNNERGDGDPLFQTADEARQVAKEMKEVAESQPTSQVDEATGFVDTRNEKQKAKGKWEKKLWNSLFKNDKADPKPLVDGALREKHIPNMSRDELANVYKQVFGRPPAARLSKEKINERLQGVRQEFDTAMQMLSNGRRVTAREAIKDFPNAFRMLVSRGVAGAWFDPQLGKLYGIPQAMLEQTIVSAFGETVSRNSLDKANELVEAVTDHLDVSQQAETRMHFIDPTRWTWKERRHILDMVRASGKSPYQIQKEQYEINRAAGQRRQEAVNQSVDAATATGLDAPQEEIDALREMLLEKLAEERKKREDTEKKKPKKKLGDSDLVLDRTGQGLMFPGTDQEVNAAHDLAAFSRKYVGGEGGLAENLEDDHKLHFENEGGAIQVAYDLIRSIWELRVDENMSPEAYGFTDKRFIDAGDIEKQGFKDEYIEDFIRDAVRHIKNQHKTVTEVPKLTKTGKQQKKDGKLVFTKEMTRNVDRKSGAYWPDYLLDNLEEEVRGEPHKGWALSVETAMREAASDKWDAAVAMKNKKKTVGKKKKSSEKLADKASKLREKKASLKQQILDKVRNQSSSTPFLTDLSGLAVDYIVVSTQEKAYSFASFIAMALEDFGPEVMEKIGDTFEMSWKLLREMESKQDDDVEYDDPQGSWRDQLDTDNNGIVHEDKPEQDPVTEDGRKPLRWVGRRDRELAKLFKYSWSSRDDLRRILESFVGKERWFSKNSSNDDYLEMLIGIEEAYAGILKEAELGQFVPHLPKSMGSKAGAARMHAIAFLKQQGAFIDAKEMADSEGLQWVSPESLLQERLTEEFPAISRKNLEDIVAQAQDMVTEESGRAVAAYLSDKDMSVVQKRTIAWEDMFDNFPFVKTGRRVEFVSDQTESTSDQNQATSNAAAIVNSDFGISPNSFFMSGLSRAVGDIDEAVEAGRPIGVAFESFKSGKFETLSDAIRGRMVEHVVEHGLPLFIDSGMFSRLMNDDPGNTPNWDSVMEFYDGFIDQLIDYADQKNMPSNIGLVSMVMPDKLVKQPEAVHPEDFIVGLGKETAEFQAKYSREINDLATRGVSLIMPVQRPSGGAGTDLRFNYSERVLDEELQEGQNDLFDRVMDFMDPKAKYTAFKTNDAGEVTYESVELTEEEVVDREAEGDTSSMLGPSFDFNIRNQAIVGIPYGESPWPDDNILDMVMKYREIKKKNGKFPPLRIHLLGSGASRTTKLWAKIVEVDPTVRLTGDSSSEVRNRGRVELHTGKRKQPYQLPDGRILEDVMGQFWQENGEATDLKKLRQTIYRSSDLPFTGQDREGLDERLKDSVIERFQQIVDDYQSDLDPNVLQEKLEEFFFKQPFQKLVDGNPSIFKEARDNERAGLGGSHSGLLADLRIYLEESDVRADDARRDSGNQDGGEGPRSGRDDDNEAAGGEHSGTSERVLPGSEQGGSSEGVRSDKGSPLPRSDGDTDDKDGSTGRGNDSGGTARDGDSRVESDSADSPEPSAAVRDNYHLKSERFDKIVGGGKVTKFKRNKAAIEIVKALQEENRDPTADELDTLAGYTGWGQFGQELFQGTWEEAVGVKEDWEDRDTWLRGHLGQKEWDSLRMSIANAHYTAPEVVEAMWSAVRRLGFNGGRVLEPAVGSGNFFSVMPRDLMEKSQLTGIDLEMVAAQISAILHPSATILNHSYAIDNAPDNHYDLTISNVPFGDFNLADRVTPAQSIHNFYFSKAIRQTKEGGLIAMVTSTGTLDADGIKKLRSEWMGKADVLGVVRLPRDAFAANAGTKVVTDIIFMRKLREGEAARKNGIDIREVKAIQVPDRIEGGEAKVVISEHYADNPQDILGTTVHARSLYGPAMTVESKSDANLIDDLNAWASTLPENVFDANDTSHILKNRVESGDNALQNSVKFDPKATYTTSYTSKDKFDETTGKLVKAGKTTTNILSGAFLVRRGNEWMPHWDDVTQKGVRFHTSSMTNSASLDEKSEQLQALIDVANKLQIVMDAQITTEAVEERKALNEAYDAYFAKYGRIRSVPKPGKSFRRNPLVNFLVKVGDPRGQSLEGLDIGNKKASIFTKNTVRGRKTLVAGEATLDDAFLSVRNKDPRFLDVEEIANLTGKPQKEVEQELIERELAYRTAGGNLESADVFLSGNVRAKLLSLKQARDKEGKRGLDKSIAAIEGKIPKSVTFKQIKANMGSMWMPASDYVDFFSELTGVPPDQIAVRRQGNAWRASVTPRGLQLAGDQAREWTAEGVSLERVVNTAMSNGKVKVYTTNEDGDKRFDEHATDDLNRRIGLIRTQFKHWIWVDVDRQDRLEDAYNERFNSNIPLSIENIPLVMEGLALEKEGTDFGYYEHQARAIYRGLVYGKGLFAHEVGTGKTYTMAGLALESKRLGLANKPLMMAHNANYEEVAQGVREAYPNANILVVTSVNPKTAAQQLNSIATGDWDLVIVPESQVGSIKFKEETIRDIMQSMLDDLEIAARASQSDEGGADIDWDMDIILDAEELRESRLKPTAKQLVKERFKILAKIEEAVSESSVSSDVYFENWGTDMLLVDEVHKYKKIPIATKMNIKGMTRQGTQTASQLYMATQYVQNLNNGRNVFTFTGTPITNQVSELFNQMRYIMKSEMDDADIGTWDGWFGAFGEATVEPEITPGGQHIDVERITKFVNIPELRQFMSSYLDTVFADQLEEYTPRKERDGRSTDKREIANVPYMIVENLVGAMTSGQEAVGAELATLYQQWLDASGTQKRLWSMEPGRPHHPGVLNLKTNPMSLDPRLVGEEADPLDPQLKVNRMVAKAKEIYDNDPGSTQMIFVDQGWNPTSPRTVRHDEDGNPIKEDFPVFVTEKTESETYVQEVIKRLMEETGVKRSEIVNFGKMNAKQKAAGSKKMNNGTARFAIGSTQSMGTGVNAQKNLRALHHLDAPWTPAELEQRVGRIRRQGNEWNTVYQYRYMTKSPQEARRWQVLLKKLRFINSFMRNDGIERELDVDDDDDAMGLMAALESALGDPRVIRRTKLKSKADRMKQDKQMFHMMEGRRVSALEQMVRSLPFQQERVRSWIDIAKSYTDNAPKTVKDVTGKKVPEYVMLKPVADGSETIVGKKEINEYVQDKFQEFDRIGQTGSDSFDGAQTQLIGEFRGNYVVFYQRGKHQKGELWYVPKTGLAKNNPMSGWVGLHPPIAKKDLDGKLFNGRKNFVQGLVTQHQSLIREIKSQSLMNKDMERKLAKYDPAAPPSEFSEQAALDKYVYELDLLQHELKVSPFGSPIWLQSALPIGEPFYVAGIKYTIAGWRGDKDVLADTGATVTESPPAGVRPEDFVPSAPKPVLTPFPAVDATDSEGTPLVAELQTGYTGDNLVVDEAENEALIGMPEGTLILINVPGSIRDANPDVGQFQLTEPVLLASASKEVKQGDKEVELMFGSHAVVVPARLFNMSSRASDSEIVENRPSLQSKISALESGRLSITASQAAGEYLRAGQRVDGPTHQGKFLNELLGGLYETYGHGEEGEMFTTRGIESRDDVIRQIEQVFARYQSNSGGGISSNPMSPGNSRKAFPVPQHPSSGNRVSDRGLDSQFSEPKSGTEKKSLGRRILDRLTKRKNLTGREIGQKLARMFGVSIRFGTFNYEEGKDAGVLGYQAGLSSSSGQKYIAGEKYLPGGAARLNSDNAVRVRPTEVQNLAVQIHELAHGIDEIHGISQLFQEWEDVKKESPRNFIENTLADFLHPSELARIGELRQHPVNKDLDEALEKMIMHQQTDAIFNTSYNIEEISEESWLREAMRDFLSLYLMPDNSYAEAERDAFDGYREMESWYDENIMDSKGFPHLKSAKDQIERRGQSDLIQLNRALKEMDYEQDLVAPRAPGQTGLEGVMDDLLDDTSVLPMVIQDKRRVAEGWAEFIRAFLTMNEGSWDDIRGFRTVLDFFDSHGEYEGLMKDLRAAREIVAEFHNKPELDRLNAIVVDAGQKKAKAGPLRRIIDLFTNRTERIEQLKEGRLRAEQVYRHVKDRARPMKLNADEIRKEDERKTERNRVNQQRWAAAQGIDPDTLPDPEIQDTFSDNPDAYTTFSVFSNTVPSFVNEALTMGVMRPNDILAGGDNIDRGIDAPKFYEALGALLDDGGQDKKNADLYMVIKHQQMMDAKGTLSPKYRWPINRSEGKRFMDNLSSEQVARYEDMFSATNNMLNELRIMEYQMGMIGRNDLSRMFKAYTTSEEGSGDLRVAPDGRYLSDAYIPLERVKPGESGVSLGRGRVLNPNALQRRSDGGSDLEVRSPIDVAMDKALRSYSAVNRHMVTKEVVRSNVAAGNMARDVTKVDPADKRNVAIANDVMDSLVKEGFVTKAERSAIKKTDLLLKFWDREQDGDNTIPVTISDDSAAEIEKIAGLLGREIPELTDELRSDIEKSYRNRTDATSKEAGEILNMLEEVPARYAPLFWHTEDVDRIIRENNNVHILREPAKPGDKDIFGVPLPSGEMKFSLFEFSEELQKGMDVNHPWMSWWGIAKTREIHNKFFKAGAVGFNAKFGVAQYFMDSMSAMYNSTEMGFFERLAPVVGAKSIVNSVKEIRKIAAVYWRGETHASNESDFDKLYRIFGGGMNPDMSMSQGEDQTSFADRNIKKGFRKTTGQKAFNASKIIEFNSSLNPSKWNAGAALRFVREVITSADAGPRKQEALAYLRNRGFTLNKNGMFVNADGVLANPGNKLIVEAIAAGNDITYNYKRVGYTTQVVESVRPFTQAQLEGIDKAVRTLGEDAAVAMRVLAGTQKSTTEEDQGRLRRMKANLVTTVLFPVAYVSFRVLSDLIAGIDWEDDDEDEVSDWMLANGFAIDFNSDGVVDLQTPGNRENSIRAHLGQLLYETIKWGMNSDESQSEIEKRLVEDGQGRLSRMIESLERQTFDYSFTQDMKDSKKLVSWAFGSGIFGTAIGWLSNRNAFRDSPIENPWDVQTNELKSEIFNRSTTAVWKNKSVREGFGDMGLSPSQMDYITSSMSGGGIERVADYAQTLSGESNKYGNIPGMDYLPGMTRIFPARRMNQSGQDLYSISTLLDTQRKLSIRDKTDSWTPEHEAYFKRVNSYKDLYSKLMKVGREAKGDDARFVDNMAVGLARAGLMRSKIKTGTDPMTMPLADWPSVLKLPFDDAGESSKSFLDSVVAEVQRQKGNLNPPERNAKFPLNYVYADGKTKRQKLMEDAAAKIGAKEFFDYYRTQDKALTRSVINRAYSKK